MGSEMCIRDRCYTQGLIFYLALSSGQPTLMAARITRTLSRFRYLLQMTNEQCEFLKRVRARPSMFVFAPDFNSVCAYIDGMHAATGCLTGFREWLVVHLDGGDNLIWQGLVKCRLQNESISKIEYVASLGMIIEAVSYTHLTLPTIYSV